MSSCTTLTTMCPTCVRTLQAILSTRPGVSINPMPAKTYPVAFRASFPEHSIPFDYAVRVANAVEKTLLDVFGQRMPVLAFNSFEDVVTRDSKIYVSILIEFPGEDGDVVANTFSGVSEGLKGEGWECLLPRQGECPSTFWLRWHADPMKL
ncbi:uncharacterized protein DSM5745_11223 [Aspergillus mulundensis]|uniref:Uncharacterized protein n=1 Tax=Aspergillus mulundensis TaxID=1810919 RepID=A0A3D8Q9K7_9EURO|nr:hypothetical protein DSM5745_11223 [Aspergillus mulundensis]RDW58532.1 hypothetical protein DSM5745_11223 [Aspergillus mulundensis]